MTKFICKAHIPPDGPAPPSRKQEERRPGKRGIGVERGPPQRCDTYNPTTAKRAAPLPGDHNQLYQVAISQSPHSPAPMSQESHKQTAFPERYYGEVGTLPQGSRSESTTLTDVGPGLCEVRRTLIRRTSMRRPLPRTRMNRPLLEAPGTRTPRSGRCR